jgi:hypothetical protein
MRMAAAVALVGAALLVPLAPTATAGTPAPALLVPVNPGFEDGATGWTFTGGSGVATNKPHGGTHLAYLDSGAGKQVSQTITAGGAGSYEVSAWIATGGTGGTFTVSVNGTPTGTITLPSLSTYSRYTISRVDVSAGDTVQIAFGSGNGWVNMDDVMISPSAPADPEVTSSNPKIAAMFDWAKEKADSWVHQDGAPGLLNVDEKHPAGTGTGTYAATYWAGYAYRSGFYSRDFAHQTEGAHLLGLDAQNKTMLTGFAASATEARKYYPLWSLNFDATTPLAIDYHGDTNFVREVPATFELVEKAAAQYRWTGDRSYLDDPVLWDYYQHATGDFVDLHDTAVPNGDVKVAEGTGNGIFQGAASYNEQTSQHLAEAGDGIGSQYQAYLAMAALAHAKGDDALADSARQRAAALKTYFNTTWSRLPGTDDDSSDDFVRAYTTSGQPITGWGKENSWFMPMKDIVDPGPRDDAYLSFIDQQASGSGRPANIEAVTYLPDTFFRHNWNDTAWKWMQDIYDRRGDNHVNTRQGLNGDYPEVAFTMVSQTVDGLMGVEPDAPGHAVVTQSRLPAGIGWLQVSDIPIGKDTITVRHDGTTASTLTNKSATHPYKWEARFAGAHRWVTVDGKRKQAKTKVVDGITCTYAKVEVLPGHTASVQAGD